jgi:hypothetical protein
MAMHVERYQMTTHPGKFTGNPDVMQLIREKQMAALPIMVLHGRSLRRLLSKIK